MSELNTKVYNMKRDFVQSLSDVLHKANPDLACCWYVVCDDERPEYGEDLRDTNGSHLVTGDEYIIVLCRNGYYYYVNVTANSLMTMAAELFRAMAGK